MIVTRHGERLEDPYAWLREREDPAVRAYLEAENTCYTSAAARDRLKAGKRVRWTDRFLSPPARFLRTYFLRLGILDGYPGFVLSVLGAFYVFARYTKMWQMQNA